VTQLSAYIGGGGGGGPQGPQGFQGASGSQGPQGFQGASGGGGGTILLSNVAPISAGVFTASHSLGSVPLAVVFTMTSGGQIWLNTANVSLGYDSSNVYCVASDGNVTAHMYVF
jgi:hypothetical protein